jgi:hypothetical protein
MTQLVTTPAPTRRHVSAAAGSVGCRLQKVLPATCERGRQMVPTGLATPVSARSGRSAHGLELLGSYTGGVGRNREVIAARRGDGCVLVIDRDELTLGDRRLVACLAADEPASNAALMCALYLEDHKRGRCRRVRPEDLIDVALITEDEVGWPCPGGSYMRELVACSRGGKEEVVYNLEPVSGDRAVAELRWRVRPRAHPAHASHVVSLRHVVATIESYEPVFERSFAALAAHEDDPKVSGTTLRQELERLRESPVVLNRGLREAVRAAIERGVSMGEIALRCNRVKRDGHGNSSGETSWLARRVGMAPESGGSRPTPWIHSEVLALIAREGLGIGPHEVEL